MSASKVQQTGRNLPLRKWMREVTGAAFGTNLSRLRHGITDQQEKGTESWAIGAVGIVAESVMFSPQHIEAES
jgi:hypothetical protein